MSAEETVKSLIENAKTQANTNATLAQSYAATAVTDAAHILGITEYNAIGPNIPAITFDPTAIDLTSDFLNGYNNAIADWDPDFRPSLLDAMGKFLDRYFPNYTQCLKTALDSADSWLCRALTVGGTGMSAAVENAIWNRGREREVIDARRVVDEAVSGFAARGWSLPSGALVDTVYRAQQAASDKAGTISRDVMIKQAEIEIENIKFAVDKAIQLRLGVINALLAFVKEWIDLRQLAVEKGKAIVEAKTKLYQAIGEYYRAIISAAGLLVELEKIKVESRSAHNAAFAQNALAGAETRARAAIAAADAMAQIASAALGAMNTLGEVAHQTSVNAES